MNAYETVVRSKVVEGRRVSHPCIPDDDAVARLSWRRCARRAPTVRDLGGSVFLDSPKMLNAILGPEREWSSPTVPTLNKSCMALHWMREHDANEHNRLLKANARVGLGCS